MAIKDLQAKQSKVDIVVEVVEVGEVREFNKFGKAGRVANATVKDETGEIKMSLWNEQVDQIKPGDKVQITNGYVNEYQGEKQLTTGRFGKLEIIGKAEPKSETKKTTEAKKAKEEPAEEENYSEEENFEELSVEEEEIK